MRASSVAGGSENFAGEWVACFGDGEHDGKQIGEIGDRLADGSAAPVLAGDDPPVLHDAGDQLLLRPMSMARRHCETACCPIQCPDPSSETRRPQPPARAHSPRSLRP